MQSERYSRFCLLQSCCFGLCVVMLCLLVSRGIHEDENRTMVLTMITSLSVCFPAATTVYNSLPNPRLDICKTLSVVHIQQFSCFPSPIILFLPIIQYITSYQCVRKLHLLHVSGLISYLFTSMACCSKTKKKDQNGFDHEWLS